MNIPSEFDEIRPFEPEELPEVFKRLVADPQFRTVMAYALPGIPFETIEKTMLSCTTGLEFQFRLCYKFLENIVAKCTDGCTKDFSAIDSDKRYTFISNHRDIVIDPAFLCKMLIDAEFKTTCEIAIGDNLLSLPWVKDLVRVNKSFIVRRGLSPRETLRASKTLSEYMHFVMAVKHDNMWIAQREGRAKDSDDRTQPAILKMLAMGGKTPDVIGNLISLHIVPLTISYEYDPCDYLKAAEFQLKRDMEGWKKTKEEDVISMQTGVTGFKGRVHYHAAPCIDTWLATIAPDTPKTELFDMIAEHIDREIHRNYRLYPPNYVALDLLNNDSLHNDKYSADDKAAFTGYIDKRLSMIDIPNKDEAFLRERLLVMYANPVVNHLAVCSWKGV